VQYLLSIDGTITGEFGAVVIEVLNNEAIEFVDCPLTRVTAPPDRVGEQLQRATVSNRVMCKGMAVVPFTA